MKKGDKIIVKNNKKSGFSGLKGIYVCGNKDYSVVSLEFIVNGATYKDDVVIRTNDLKLDL